MDICKPDKNRILTVFKHGIPDRVPNFEVLVDNPTLSYIMDRPMPSHTLDNIPPEDVRRDARTLIDSVGADGGLVMASSHSITKNVKPENFLAMIETAQQYGKYK